MAVPAKELPSVADPRPASRLVLLWRSTIGKKALMAVTGLVLFAYLVVHMAGNLKAFAGGDELDAWAAFLHSLPGLLWAARVILLAALVVHVGAGVELWARARTARPTAYAEYRPGVSSAASRTMIWSGVLILAFVVYHVLDLTVGVANPDYQEGDVFHNVLATFGQVAGVVAYLVAMVGLGFHLWHGIYSAFQSLGVSNRRITPSIQRAAALVAVVLALGFSSIPLAVVVGILHPGM
jgi:succinate dehydrogenase / fumarate reductase cytochrome b subunit